MEYIQNAWKPGASYTKGLSADEYFFDQIYNAVKANVTNRTLPFFNQEAQGMPVELTTGKLINDRNLIALEQSAAKNGYTSNVWIYASELEKLSRQGYKIGFKKGAEPVLCMTKFENPTHLSRELYIHEGGNGQRIQFLYNMDSLDDRSKKILSKHYENAREHESNLVTESFQNYIENSLKAKNQKCPELQKLKETVMHQCEILGQNLAPVITAQAKHICVEATGRKELRRNDMAEQERCYKVFEEIFSDAENRKIPSWKVGETLTKALDSGTWYAKSYTAKDFNLETNKLKEENINRQANLNKRKSYDLER